MTTKLWTTETLAIDGLDDLRWRTHAADIEIVQLQPGKLRGVIHHHTLGGTMVVRRGKFNCGIRTRGSVQAGRVLLMVVLDSAGQFIQWGQEVRAGDIAILPAKAEFDFIIRGSTDYVVVSLPMNDLLSGVVGEDRFADPDFWERREVLSTPPPVAASLLRELDRILSKMEQTENPSPQAVDLLRRAILGCLLDAMAATSPSDTHSSPLATLVSRVDDYLGDTNGREVPISELLDALGVSRRSLERAFRAALGIGPAAYLRRKRLSAVYSILRESDPAIITVPEVMTANGFSGWRSSADYRKLFGETPTQTLKRRR